MWNSSIQNMDSGHSVFNRSYTVLQFRDHSSGNCSAFDQFIRLIYSKSCDQRRFILVVSVYPFNIREERKLLSMNRFCDRISCIIRIDIISVVIIIDSDRAYDRKKIFIQKIQKNLCIDLLDISYNPTSCPVMESFLSTLKSPPSFPLTPIARTPSSSDHTNQIFINLVQYHLCNFHGLCIRHTKSVDEFRLHSGFTYPFTDLFFHRRER